MVYTKPVIIIAFLLVLILPGNALAIQAHGGPEGYYVHQLGHVIYAFSMIVFAYRLAGTEIINPKTRCRAMTGAFFLFLWNVWAFFGHLLTRELPSGYVAAYGNYSTFSVTVPVRSLAEGVYYLLKLDHLLCVPALFFLYLAVRKGVSVQSSGHSVKNKWESG